MNGSINIPDGSATDRRWQMALLGTFIATQHHAEIRQRAENGDFAWMSPGQLNEVLELALRYCGPESALLAREALSSELGGAGTGMNS